MGQAGTLSPVAVRIATLREQRGWSRRALASRAGVSFGFVSRIEKGDRTPAVETIRLMAQALGVSPHWLETGDNDGDYVYLSKTEKAVVIEALDERSVTDEDAASLYDRLRYGAGRGR